MIPKRFLKKKKKKIEKGRFGERGVEESVCGGQGVEDQSTMKGEEEEINCSTFKKFPKKLINPFGVVTS